MGPGDLQKMTCDLETPLGSRDAAVLVGTETGDDAGVYLLPSLMPDGGLSATTATPSVGAAAASGLALVQTADYITPPFDDPESYGRIAAANSLSDVYAMGGTPITALNLCVFPKDLDLQAARAILHGAAQTLKEAGAALLGGHTVRGPELLFGLSVSGLVSPSHIWRNVGAQPGDVLLLTKPLGAGLIVTGCRKGLVSKADQAACQRGLMQLNKAAAQTLARFTVHAATDVTGFSLVGHALGMTRRNDVSLQLHCTALPLYAGALALAAAGITCGGAQNNRRAYREQLGLCDPSGQPTEQPLSAAYEEVLFDPQTSGGLLCALPEAEAEAALKALMDAGVTAACVGKVRALAEKALLIVPQ